MPAIRQVTEARLREVVRLVERAQRDGVGSPQTRTDVLSCARELLGALPLVYDASGAVTNEAFVQFMADFHAFVLQDFPLILTNGFHHFGLEPRYEMGAQTPDLEYTYQNAWAAEHIFRLRPEYFVDVGSETPFCTLVSRAVPCIAIDSRPTPLYLENLSYLAEEAQKLSFDSGSVPMLTSLHAPEHFGLGRYGDTLDQRGVERAIQEFLRVVTPGGHLIISMPAGPRSQIVFNALRIHTREMMRELCPGCEIVDELFLAPDPVSHDELVRRVDGGMMRSGTHGIVFQKPG